MLVLVALAVAIHAPFTGGGLLTDDFLHLERLQRQTFLGVFVSPDTFGFYRPLPQASLWLNLQVAGPNASLLRLTNVLIHAAVICAAYLFARLTLKSTASAFFATLAFVLTPKAHPVAVLWISARAELLMALFALTAIICWIRWHSGDGRSWLALAWLSYLLALTCKETAVLLPLLMFFTPVPGQTLTRTRVVALLGMLLSAVVLLGVRFYVGALMPVSSDPHYDLATPIGRWFRNGRNYFWRALVSPTALVVLAAVARLVDRKRDSDLPHMRAPLSRLARYAAVWFIVFIIPVLPIVARSELYLYLPVLGLCLVAGSLVESLLSGGRTRDPRCLAALVVYVLAVGGFQVSRAAALHADALFSARFLAAVREDDAIAHHTGSVVFIPADAVTSRFLQDAIGGYIGTAVDRAVGRHVPAGVGGAGTVHEPDALLLHCAYRDGHVTLYRRSR
jgi:hypothetical protein